MSNLHDKYRALRDALVTAPEYMALPSRDRAACTRFCGMVATLGSDGSPPALEIRVAFEAAMKEAHELVAAGKLTADLDDEGPVEVSDTERPPADEPETTVGSEGTPPEPKVTDTGAEPTGGEPPEDPLALFHDLVARGAKYEEYPIHPAADLFPLIEGEERKVFDDGLEVDGLLEDIVVHEGKVIDGRNRLRGCLGRGVVPRFVQWKPEDGETVANYVVKKNLHRRHLNDQQRAMLGAQLVEVLAAEGKRRRAENLRKTSEIPDGANLPHRAKGRSAERAAEMVSVSETAVKKAARIRRTGDKTLVAAVTAGDISIDAAVQVAEMSAEEQREAVKKGKVKEVAKRVRKERAASKPKAKPKPKGKAAKPTEDEDPLLVEVREATTEMAAEARRAGRLDEITPTLRKVANGFRLWAQRLREGTPLK